MNLRQSLALQQYCPVILIEVHEQISPLLLLAEYAYKTDLMPAVHDWSGCMNL